jgi:hypothetical protein
MILSVPIDDFQINSIFFLETKKNINMNGTFTKLNYVINDISLNGIYITYSLQRFKYENTMTLQTLNQIEMDILNRYKEEKNAQKTTIHSLLPHLMAQSKNVELCDENTWFSNYQTNVIKISGIWETTNSIGITYRIIHI